MSEVVVALECAEVVVDCVPAPFPIMKDSRIGFVFAPLRRMQQKFVMTVEEFLFRFEVSGPFVFVFVILDLAMLFGSVFLGRIV